MDHSVRSLLEIVRHILIKHPELATNIKNMATQVEASAGANKSAEEVFTWIYKTNFWGDRESVSGVGSTLAYTENLRKELPKMLADFSIQSIVDAPCGDFNWMRHVLADSSQTYIGLDVVGELIALNQSKYASDRISFEQKDITKDPLPKADLMICRDCLFHLSNSAIKLILGNFLAADIKYLFTTTHINQRKFTNQDIRLGGFRLIDLYAAPFHFPAPALCTIEDWIEGYPPRQMALWSKDQVASALAKFG